MITAWFARPRRRMVNKKVQVTACAMVDSRCCRYSASCDQQKARVAVRRNLAALALVAATLIPAVAACSHSGSNQSQSTASTAPASGQGQHGPFFPQCGGISDETVTKLTEITGLVNTAKNSVGCQWLAGGGILGPHFSFSWYRGSPIGRERKTEELSRTSVEDINIDGHGGFVAVGNDPTLGDSLCEVGIQFSDDFIEWSVNFSQKPFPDACNVAKELARQSIENSK
jgi:hypothetical protein